MKFSFTIYYDDNSIHHMDAMDSKKLVPQACIEMRTIEAETLEDAILDIQADLKADNKTLKSLTLLNIEV
jgi:hypothetical protein